MTRFYILSYSRKLTFKFIRLLRWGDRYLW